MKNKDLMWVVGIIVVIGLFMFSSGKKEAGDIVQFRTTSSTYGSGGAVALAESCGGALTAYGYKSSSFYSCSPDEIILYTNEGYPVCKRDSYPDRVYVIKGDSGAYYEIGDSDASKVSTSTTSSDPSLEVICSSEPTCTDTSWTPSPSSVCSGESFTQTSNCGNVRSSIGTMDCSTPTITCNICADTDGDSSISDSELLAIANEWLQ